MTCITWALVLAFGVARETTEVDLEYTLTDSNGGIYETAAGVVDNHSTVWFVGGLMTVLAAALASMASRTAHGVTTVVGLLGAGAVSLIASVMVWFAVGFWGDPVTPTEVAVFAVLVFIGCWSIGWAIGAVLGSPDSSWLPTKPW